MSYKTITTVLTDYDAEAPLLENASKLAEHFGAHLDAICLGVDRTQPGFYYAGASAMAIQANLELAAKTAEELEAKVSNHLKGADFGWTTQALATQSVGLAQFLAYHTRFSDLAVLGKPYSEGNSYEHEAIVESALFDAQIPVMVLPNRRAVPEKFGRVVVAWNESREALRAIRAALPMLAAAEQINVVIVDPPLHAPDRSDPGGALCQMLVRHGARVEVTVLSKTMPRVSDVLARHADDVNADVLVMGAYGHSRFRESILGGATRNLLQTTDRPLFLAH